jgi:HEAT repeat protein
VSPALLLVVLLATGQSAGTGTKDCWMSCQRHVTDTAQRARACRACLPGGRVDAWVGALEDMRPSNREALVSARKDADWRVRWAAVRADARLRGVTERRLLAEWVAATPASADLDACLTAARAAVEAGQSSADFLKDAGARGPEAAARVWARREGIRKALELELYAEDMTVRGTALAHLSGFLGRRPARVVLDALASRPEAGDGITASALKVVAERKRTSVGRLLLDEARPADEARVNRLFAVYSRELEALQVDLAGPDPLQRRKAVQSLRVYGPLARRELEHALEDVDRWVREAAARGLADAEGVSLRLAAERRLVAGDATVARPWLEAMVHEKGCAAFLLGAARETQLPAALRGDALAQLSDCDEGSRERFASLALYLKDSQVLVRAGAVRALGLLSARRTDVAEATARALADPAPEVVAAALEAVGNQRQSTRGDDAAGLLGSEHPVVRAAAAKALEHIGRSPHVKDLSVCLREDPVASVRVAAAQALGSIGGPQAAAALSDAAARDADTHVQHVSREGLRRLGFGL